MADIGPLSQLHCWATIPPKKIATRETLPWAPRGFSYAVSGFAARVFRHKPKTCRPAADEAPCHTGEKTSGTQGRETCL